MKRLLLAVILICSPLYATTRHVVASGGVTTGTAADSSHGWTLSWALSSSNSTLSAGDTVYIHAGTYAGMFLATKSGTNGSPIIYRAMPGQRVTIDSGSPFNGNYTLGVNASYVWFWGLEIMSSATTKSGGDETYGQYSWPDNIGQPEGIVTWPTDGTVDIPGIKIIRCIIHDTRQGFSHWSGAWNSEVTDCVFFDNGWTDAQNNGRGHNWYIQTRSMKGTVKFTNNIDERSYGEAFQLYGSGGTTYGDSTYFLKNFFSEDGSAYPAHTGRNGLIRPGNVGNDDFYQNNVSYSDMQINLLVASDGAGVGLNRFTMTNNLMFGAGADLTLTNYTGTPTITGNKAYSTENYSGTFSNNLWSTSKPSTWDTVVIHPFTYEKGAHIAVLNTAGLTSKAIDFSGFLSNGDKYTVVDAQNYYGTPLATGTYSGGTVSIPLDGRAGLPATIGNDLRQMQHTSSEFNVFVVMSTRVASVTTQSPTVATSSVTGLTQSGATLNGTVNPNGSSTTYHFDYGTTTSYGTSTTSTSAGSGTNTLNESATITGLTSGTTYHYRIVATNSGGTTNGSDASFQAATSSSFFMLQRMYWGTGRPTDAYFQDFGINPLTVVYQDETGCPPFVQATVQAAAAAHAGDGHQYANVDMECLDASLYDSVVVGASTAKSNMNDVKQMYNWYKAATSQTVGLYGFTPEEVDIHWVSPTGFNLSEYQTINNVMQPLADAEDYLSPSIYTTITDSVAMQWKVQIMTQEAVRLAKGKPVYPFISPQYYSSDMTLVSYGFWKMILNTLKSSGASGAIVFVWQPITWDSTAGWWTATKEFISGIYAGPPSTPTANPASNVGANSFTANWSAAVGAASYRLDVSTNSDFTSYISGDSARDVGNVTSFSVTGLSSGAMYYYRVRALNAVGLSANSNVISVTTLTPPPTPVALLGSGATNTRFTANWIVNLPSTTGYYLDVSTSTGFGSFVTGYNNKNVGLVDSASVTGLSASTTYYYRLRAYNAAGTSGNSNVDSAKTLANPIVAPGAPTATAATNITQFNFVANWGAVSAATGYYLDVSTVNTFTSYVDSSLNVGNVVAYLVSPLAKNTTYYYRVRAYNPAGASTSSNTITAATTDTVPNTPVADIASSITQTSFAANWEADAGATSYRLDVATDGLFVNYVSGYQNLTVGSVTTYPVVGLIPSTIYYYRIRAVNAVGTTVNSNVVTVTTSAIIPSPTTSYKRSIIIKATP